GCGRSAAPDTTRDARRPRGRLRPRAAPGIHGSTTSDAPPALDGLLESPALMEIAFDERGLAPCVIQDWATGEVLTLAYMNAEALARTRETGELHLWSRSRDE